MGLRNEKRVPVEASEVTSTSSVHGQCEGHNRCRSTAFYTPEFCKRVIQSIKTDNLCGKVVRELQDGTNIHGDMNHGLFIHENEDEKKEENNEMSCWVMSPEQRTKTFQALRRIHSATGHCSQDYLIRALRRRNVGKEVLELAKQFTCPSCEERERQTRCHKSRA